MHSEQLSRNRSVLLIVDIQEAFVKPISNIDSVIERTAILIQAAKLLELPIIVSEQYPKGLGRTVPVLQQLLGDIQYYDKTTFSCCHDDKINTAIRDTARRQIIIAGVETHVCIEQTVMDLLSMNIRPYIIADAVSSRHSTDTETALNNMQNHGAIVTTTEAAIFAMIRSSKHPAFKEISKLVK